MIQLSELSVTDGKLLFKKYRDGKTQKNRGKKMIQLSELIVTDNKLLSQKCRGTKTQKKQMKRNDSVE